MAYGDGDSSFQTAGGDAGLRRLADSFYDHMERLEQTQTILHMHPKDLETSRDKLARFLCGWLGGPNRYNEKYGRINIPSAHQHLKIGTEERDAWLHCMSLAVADQPWPDDFKSYLLTQLAVPAEAVRRVSERVHSSDQKA